MADLTFLTIVPATVSAPLSKPHRLVCRPTKLTNNKSARREDYHPADIPANTTALPTPDSTIRFSSDPPTQTDC
jgi:hypothetical protein